MKPTLHLVLAMLAGAPALAVADSATTAPDFLGAAPRRHLAIDLVASDSTNRIEPQDVIAFSLDSYRLSEGGYVQVDRAADWLRRNPRFRIVLEGHTDQLGLAAYNEDLATKRNKAVRRRLLDNGIASDRIVMVTFGERQAMSPDNPEERRVVMYATELAPTQVVSSVIADGRDALVATWTERGTALQLRGDRGPQRPPVISRR